LERHIKINRKRDLICNFVPPIFKYLQKCTGFKNNTPGFSIRKLAGFGYSTHVV
jgi:hypothetical protein